MTNRITKSNAGIYQGGPSGAYLIPSANTQFFDQLSQVTLDNLGKQVAANSYQQGIKDQQKAAQKAQQEAQYTDPGSGGNGPKPYTPTPITGDATGAGAGNRTAAYIKGVNAAWAIQKKQQLDTGMFDLLNAHRNDPQALKNAFNNQFLPEYTKGLTTATAPAYTLDAKQRFERIYQQALNNQYQTTMAKNEADMTTRADTLNAEIYNMISAGEQVDPNNGQSLQEKMAEASHLVGTLADTNPGQAAKINQHLQQNIREAEWLHAFRATPDSQKLDFIHKAENFAVNTKNMQGEVLQPERRKRVISEMYSQWNKIKSDSAVSRAALSADLSSTEKALMNGSGANRDLQQLIDRTYQAYPKDVADHWKQRLLDAQQYANEITSIQTMNMPDLVQYVQKVSADYQQAQQDFNAGKINAQQMNFQHNRLTAVQKYANERSKAIAHDPWNALTPQDVQHLDLTSPDGVQQARAMIAEKAGVPLYRVPPMSSSQITAFKHNFESLGSPSEQAAQLMNLHKRLGDSQFFNVFDQLHIDKAWLPIALSGDVTAAGNMAQMMKDGAVLAKSADKATKDAIKQQFDNQFGNAFNMQISVGQDYYDLYQKYYLVAQQSGVRDPAKAAFDKITAGRKIIDLPGGQKQLVPANVDTNKLIGALDKVKNEWRYLGIETRPGTSLEDFTYSQVTPQVYGNTVYFVDNQRNVVRVRTKNNTVVPLTVDLSNYDIDRAQQQPGERNATWGEGNVKVNGGMVYENKKMALDLSHIQDPAQKLDHIANLLLNDPKSVQHFDYAAHSISNLPIDQSRLQSLSFLLRNGQMPDWVQSYIRTFPALRVRNPDIFKQIQQDWPDIIKHGYTMPGGAAATPLQLLVREVQRRNQVSVSTTGDLGAYNALQNTYAQRGGSGSIAGETSTHLREANRVMHLTPQETYLYQTHLHNLQTAPVHNSDGSTSTLLQISVGIGNKFYNLPTVWDGKKHSPDAAVKHAEQIGLDKFPSYATEQQANDRYQQMHKYMAMDLAGAGK